MNWKEAYTKIFLRESGKSVNESTLKEFMPVWWQNTRSKSLGGLRLTDQGIEFVTEQLDLATYDIPFPKDFKLTSNVLVWLDEFIDCPYWIGSHGMIVTNEKKALELHLFSGDVKKYGINKALSRQKNEE
tara:strand:- start:546 stop:935 length:390 start_codon:yes stop_codon:yes gene_type:complete